jgi:hypothetical protein
VRPESDVEMCAEDGIVDFDDRRKSSTVIHELCKCKCELKFKRSNSGVSIGMTVTEHKLPVIVGTRTSESFVSKE